jgi:hypothetical protein
MTAVAMIPMHSPEEALDEIDYATSKLGTKVCVIPAGVTRPIPEYADAYPGAFSFDCYGVDSAHDYTPVWESFRSHKVAVTAHGAPGNRYLPLPRRSPTSYMYNHILGHAAQQIDLCLSLVLSGVPKRFPDLRIAFLEGGAGWACDILHGIHEHFEKRNADGIQNYNPANVDGAMMEELCARYGDFGPEQIKPNLEVGQAVNGSAQLDEFAQSGLRDEHELVDMFGRQFYFGCEADDRSVYRAFDAKGTDFGVRLRPFFSSDIGHWDVPDITEVLLESHQLVDEGLISEADYRDFVFTNPAGLHASMNPSFFDGTPVEAAARALVAEQAKA